MLFGVTSELAHKMIFPALYAMAKRGVLKVPIIGVASPKWSLERLRKRVTESIKRAGRIDDQSAPPPSSVADQGRRALLFYPRVRARVMVKVARSK